MNKITLALLIAKPGHLRNGLQSLLRTIPQIEVLAESNDPSILLKMNDDLRPELILVDGGLIAEDDWSGLTKIKADWPGTKVLVLTENDQQGQTAKEAGADFFLLKGFPATELACLIETLLIPESPDENISHSDEEGSD
ncbi:MAG TPA: response regulator transcription factor [Anaerolineales bacterium]|nr:response regulator transcription factor [Anaerolineales bacterium]